MINVLIIIIRRFFSVIFVLSGFVILLDNSLSLPQRIFSFFIASVIAYFLWKKRGDKSYKNFKITNILLLLSEKLPHKRSRILMLEKELEYTKSLLSPEQKELTSIHENISILQSEENKLSIDIEKHKNELTQLSAIIHEKKKQILSLDDEITIQEFGLYRPHFDFANALDYKEKLTEIREVQRDLIRNCDAVTGTKDWIVKGDAHKGKKMISDTQKLLLRAFNVECDELVSKVKYSNFDASLERIHNSAKAISKLGEIMGISITPQYLKAKEKELRLAFEYQLKKQQEKEELKAARAEQREQAKIAKQLEEERKKVEKEQTHYQTAYERLESQLAETPDNPDLLEKKAKLEERLRDITKALTDIDYRQANMKAGYVYVISNIGSFGKDIYKIGMTRRLDPQERVDELGDASVPFNFDVHAMIFSDDAPALEAALHRAFENKKLNMVNHRREFFHVTLDEIKDVVKANFDKTVEFIDIPDAEQYRISQKMMSQ